LKVKGNRPTREWTAALLAAALLAAPIACGGGDDDGDEGSAAEQATTDTAAEEAAERDAALVAKARELTPIARQSQFGVSQKESIRIANAQAELLSIAQDHPEAIAPLTAALEKPDYELITDIYSFFIQLGRPGSERVLVEALNRQGFNEESTVIALAYYASGNKRLVAGARAWASEHGASFSGSPGGIGPRWGSTGLPTPAIPTAPPPSP
jgi:hypothetical protein